MINWLLVILMKQILIYYSLKIFDSYEFMLMSTILYKIVIFIYKINPQKNIKIYLKDRKKSC